MGGRRTTFNVVAPGFINTAALSYILSDPERNRAMGAMVPMRGAYPARPEQTAALLAWCVSPENWIMTGQLLFADAGFECRQRGEHAW